MAPTSRLAAAWREFYESDSVGIRPRTSIRLSDVDYGGAAALFSMPMVCGIEGAAKELVVELFVMAHGRFIAIDLTLWLYPSAKISFGIRRAHPGATEGHQPFRAARPHVHALSE